MLFLPLNVQCSSWSVDHLFTFGQFAQRAAIIGFTRVGFYNCYDHSISVDILAEYTILEGRQHIELKIMHEKSTERMLRKNSSIVLNVIIV